MVGGVKHLIPTLLFLGLASACASEAPTPEEAASVEQALGCVEPTSRRTMDLSTLSVSTFCSAGYSSPSVWYGDEPVTWAPSPTVFPAAPAKRAGVCNCAWANSFAWPLAGDTCKASRHFRCWFGTSCQYSLYYVATYSWNAGAAAWNDLNVVASGSATPGCTRTVNVKFNAL